MALPHIAELVIRTLTALQRKNFKTLITIKQYVDETMIYVISFQPFEEKSDHQIVWKRKSIFKGVKVVTTRKQKEQYNN